nr:hypothetical protein [Tanacetum cinerariifolium]
MENLTSVDYLDTMLGKVAPLRLRHFQLDKRWLSAINNKRVWVSQGMVTHEMLRSLSDSGALIFQAISEARTSALRSTGSASKKVRSMPLSSTYFHAI